MSSLIALHRIEGYIQSIYLAEHSEGLLLLDGCSRADVGRVCRYITQELKRPLSDLKLIVVTHMHPDHAGGAIPLKRLAGCRIASANVAGDWYQGMDGVLMHLSDIMLAKWVAKRKGKPPKRLWYRRKLMADIALADDQPLPGFPEWHVLFTPGHTDRDISLHHLPSHQVYVADLMVAVKGHYIPPFPVFYPNRYRTSIEKIKALKPQAVLLAHGGPIQLTEQIYAHLTAKAPTKPLTHWRSVKAKLKRVWFRKAV